ncbi:hypothetical protein CBX60_27325 [Salmonella enterica subsp. enterica serovar Pensacola]|nr:hypothetical protein [Salmonella enterica subsp. enterica serovar Pensacola]EBH1519395.1 hypothetical protein [Salmonella enterica]EDM8864363.1 hypothetical protein [Salmonella enterica subsp. enterica serovar Typhimurium]EDU6095863.1 hypothetical protein [Salmonella enterica subsp. enterica serovar Hvittingfoss]ECL5068672.1 hypothetical protein [Salmonella enterica]
MKHKMTFASLVLACLLQSACSNDHAENPSSYTYISLGEFPADRDVAENIPVARYDEISMTRKVITDGQAVSEEPRRVGLQAVATPVFNADGTSKMVLKGTFSCIPEPSPSSSDPGRTRSYGFALEKDAHPGDRLAVRVEGCAKALPVALVREVPAH